MNKKYVFTLLGFTLFQSVVAGETHIQHMQSIAEETEIQTASNKLLEAKLNNMTLKQKISMFHDGELLSITNAQQEQNNPLAVAPEQQSPSQNNYGLQQVYGLVDNLTAIIQYGNTVIPVKKGDIFDDVWKVSEISSSQVVLLNTHSKTQEKKYVYLKSNPKVGL